MDTPFRGMAPIIKVKEHPTYLIIVIVLYNIVLKILEIKLYELVCARKNSGDYKTEQIHSKMKAIISVKPRVKHVARDRSFIAYDFVINCFPIVCIT
mgnify:CR=1 FL=1